MALQKPPDDDIWYGWRGVVMLRYARGRQWLQSQGIELEWVDGEFKEWLRKVPSRDGLFQTYPAFQCLDPGWRCRGTARAPVPPMPKWVRDQYVTVCLAFKNVAPGLKQVYGQDLIEEMLNRTSRYLVRKGRKGTP